MVFDCVMADVMDLKLTAGLEQFPASLWSHAGSVEYEFGPIVVLQIFDFDENLGLF